MSKMTESVAAYEKAGHGAAFHWWPKNEAVAGLKRLLAQLEAAGDGVRLCCKPGLKPDGESTLWLYVERGNVSAESHDDDPLDASHPCPPQC